MNPLFWPTATLAILLFWVGYRLHCATTAPSQHAWLWFTALACSTPGIVFALYYIKLLGEPLWLYQFRPISGTELTAAGLGLLAGVVQAARPGWARFRNVTSRIGVPLFFGLALCLPHLKPVLRPLAFPDVPNGWHDGVCRQSTTSTCGPASAATLARLAGVNLEERDLARECFTYSGGTENWYLARALKRHGLKVQFRELDPNPPSLPFPAIAGVKMSYGSGHFIPILGMEGTNYIVGDPMLQREVKSLAGLQSDYQFTGFFMIVK